MLLSVLVVMLGLQMVAEAAILSSVDSSPGRLSCSDSKATLDSKSDLVKVTSTSRGMTMYMGYRQTTSVNQDPVVTLFEGNTRKWCKDDIEDNGDDGFGVGLLWNDNENHFYGIFTSKGTQPGKKYQDHTSGGWIPNYFGTVAQSNNVKVSVVLRMDINTGTPDKGTFVGGRLNSGKANTLVPHSATFAGDDPVIYFNGWYAPVDEPSNTPSKGSRMSCSGSSPVPMDVKFKADLSAPLEICGKARTVGGSYCNATTPATSCPRGQITFPPASKTLTLPVRNDGNTRTTSLTRTIITTHSTTKSARPSTTLSLPLPNSAPSKTRTPIYAQKPTRTVSIQPPVPTPTPAPTPTPTPSGS